MMAGGGVVELEAKITPMVLASTIMASTGGIMLGYDFAVSGGIISMPDFLKQFFPVVYKTTQDPNINGNYCKYDHQGLQLFVSSVHLAGFVASLVASYATRTLGRRLTMLIAAFLFIVSVVLNALAQDLAMLIIGRILLGSGLGFAIQAVPIFLSEIAPTRIRGALIIIFQLNIIIGLLFASLVNYGAAKIAQGWRLSLGLAGIPAVLLTIGALLVMETPISLIERGHLGEGKSVLRIIRGTENIELEFLKLAEASRVAKEVKNPFMNLLERSYWPQLVVAVALQILGRFSGIIAITFYTPVLFDTVGFGIDASLYAAFITKSVYVISTLLSIYFVDKVGRRVLLLGAAAPMIFSHLVIAIILGIKFTEHSDHLTHDFAILVVVMVCTFISAFTCSLGPLGWLISSETFPLETRTAGHSVSVCVYFLFTFIMAQAFPSMLCHFKYGIFLFFAFWVFIMSLFVLFLLPETKSVHIEDMTERVWKKHWFWKRFMEDNETGETRIKGNRSLKKRTCL